MKRILLALLLTLLPIQPAHAWLMPQAGIIVEEEDTDPSVHINKLKVTIGTLTDNGDGSASLTTGGGGGGSGDAIIINATAIDTTSTFTDNTEIAFSVADGGAGGPDVVTADIVDDTIDGTELADTIALDAATTITTTSTNTFGITGNNGNAVYTVLRLVNSDPTSGGETAQTTDLDFYLTGTINESTMVAYQAAKIRAYKVNDWFSSDTADLDSGLRFYTTNNNTPTLALTISNALVATFVGTVSTPLLSLTGTGTINGLDAIDATGETTLEAALDIAGEVTSTGMSTTVIADSIAVTSWNLTTPTITTSLTTDAKTISEAEIGILDGGLEGEGEILSTSEGGASKFLREDGDGTCSWQTVTAGSIEGTAVLSGGPELITKFLRADGDGTCSWQVPAGGGSSEVSVLLRPQSAKLPTTATAAIDAGNSGWRLLFDDTTQEFAAWEFDLDDDYSSGTLYADVYFSMASGEANEVQFEGYVMAYTPTTDTADIDTDSYDTLNEGGATTVSATAGEEYKQTITLTNADSAAGGDHIRFKLSTDSDDADNDDATGDREVRLVVIRQ